MYLSRQIKGRRRIIFDGNSIMEYGNGNVVNNMEISRSVYTSLLAAGIKLDHFNYARGSTTTQTLTGTLPTKIKPNVRDGDILVFFEIINDAHDLINDTNGIVLHANVVAYCQLARSYGLKVVCLTGTARDFATDDADVTSRIMACNALMRADPSFCDALADVGALSQFDEKADTTNATYYNADKLHLATAGYDLFASTIYNAVVTLL